MLSFFPAGGAGGGGISLDLAYGATLPTIVVDNRIFVVTDVPVPNWHVSTEQPTNLAQGDLWLQVTQGGELITVSDTPPYFSVRIAFVWQYSGSAWLFKDGYIGAGGAWRQFSFMYTRLGEKPAGSIVRFGVNGAQRDLIIMHQGKPSSIYDDSFNGGTILLMNDLYESRQWHSSNVNDYANSTIHTYLNSTFLELIDANIRAQIKQVKIPYRPGSSGATVNSGANGLPASVWLLSGYEVNWTSATSQYFPADGATLSYFAGTATTDTKRIGYLNSVNTSWWLRSPYASSAANAWRVTNNGSYGGSDCSTPFGIRPALVLPSSLLVSDTGEIITPPLTLADTQAVLADTRKKLADAHAALALLDIYPEEVADDV